MEGSNLKVVVGSNMGRCRATVSNNCQQLCVQLLSLLCAFGLASGLRAWVFRCCKFRFQEPLLWCWTCLLTFRKVASGRRSPNSLGASSSVTPKAAAAPALGGATRIHSLQLAKAAALAPTPGCAMRVHSLQLTTGGAPTPGGAMRIHNMPSSCHSDKPRRLRKKRK